MRTNVYAQTETGYNPDYLSVNDEGQCCYSITVRGKDGQGVIQMTQDELLLMAAKVLAYCAEWGSAPTQTQWGSDEREATVALSSDETLRCFTSRSAIEEGADLAAR